MYVIITYDVTTETKAGQKRLRKVARACENRGMRVQNSVFECEVDPAQLVELRTRLLSIIDPETDSIRIYNMGSNWHNHIEKYGKEKSFDIDSTLMV
jgi:CRISPR-associated protein Cas2